MNQSFENINLDIEPEEIQDLHPKRWEEGIEHHPNSVKIMRALEYIDFNLFDDHFCWKTGGDGDNGESLMYELDVLFESLDRKNKELNNDR